jgi:hypothetical protein
MKKIIVTVIIVSLFCAAGCTPRYAKINGPFVSYSRETFTQNDTGKTGLFIDGEDWYVLINLDGFEDVNMKFAGSGEFLFKSRNEILISAFAEDMKNTSAGDSTCLNKVVPKEYQKEINGRRVGVRENSRSRKSINYCPYYKEQCFDFHFSYPAKDEKKVFDIIDSIKFVDGKFSNARVKKYLYAHDKRIELIVPNDWVMSFDKAIVPKMTTIKFLPDKGNRFEMLITPYGNIFGEWVSILKAKQNAQDNLKQIVQGAANQPIFQEVQDGKFAIFYYCDLLDKDYKPNIPTEFPFLCRGHAALDGSAFYFSILYREKGGTDVQNGIEVIKNVKIFNLGK